MEFYADGNIRSNNYFGVQGDVDQVKNYDINGQNEQFDLSLHYKLTTPIHKYAEDGTPLDSNQNDSVEDGGSDDDDY